MRLGASRARYRRIIALAAAATCLLSLDVRAQGSEGAPELLLPVGARATALGNAFSAERGGESIWLNPAGLARMTKPEFALDHFQTNVIPNGESLSLVLPAGAIGVFGIGVRLFSYDSIPSTDETGQDAGYVRPRTITIGASFAASFGDRFSAGLGYALYRSSVPCTGTCAGELPETAVTSALDAGIQFTPSPTSPVQFGAVLRNLGRRLQVKDGQQADQLPTRLHLGASYRPTVASWDPGLRLLGTAELVVDKALANNEVRVGAEVGYVSGNTLLHLRGGYVRQGAQSANSGGAPSVGLGIASGRVQLDLTRIFDSFSTDLGTPPTYISIRIGL